MVRLEDQIRASSSQIGGSLKGLAATFTTAFSVQQLGQMADTYTRFTNQLKVAGLEGSNLAGVQKQLYQVAQQNGVEIEAIGTLYSRAAQNQKELGASTEDLIGLTRAVAASLRVSGTSTNEASGALLQLGQALGSPRVQAEEFNSLLDTMQPLLREASKYIDGTGDSLAGLTQKIKDQKGPGVSNVELFNAIRQAMAGLEEQAKEADLTLSGAFTNIKNSLDLFVGQALNDSGLIDSVTNAAKALGDQIEDSGSVVREAGEIMAVAFEAIADNLDTLIEAVTVLSAILVGRFAASMVSAAASTGVVSSSIFALQARALGAATSMEALAFAGRAAGASMLAAFGGPVGLAVTALTIGIGVLVSQQHKAKAAAESLTATVQAQSAQYADLRQKQAQVAAETNSLTQKQRAALTATANLTGEADKLAEAWGRVAAQAKAASVEQLRASLSQNLNVLNQARSAYRARRQQSLDNPANRPFAERGLSRGVLNDPAKALADADRAAAQEKKIYEEQIQNVKDARRLYNAEINKPLASFKPSDTASSAGSATASGVSKKTGTPSPAARVTTDAEQQRELSRIALEELQARLALATTAEKRAELQRQILKTEQAARIGEINADDRLSAAQKDAQVKALEGLYGASPADQGEITVSPGLLDRQVQRDYVDAIDRVNVAILQTQQDALQSMADMEPNTRRRAALEAQALTIQEQIERNLLDQAIATGELASATMDQKEQARRNLAIRQAAGRDSLERRNESPLEQRRRQVREDAQNMGDRIEDIEVAAMDRLGDSVANTAAEYVKLGGIAGDVINGIIRDVIRLAAQQALLGGASGGGFMGFFGRLGSIVGIGGMSSSGIAAANQTVGSTIANNAALFQDGGYTGDGPANKPAGIVHKGEYVFPADAVRRIGVQNLAAMANSRAASAMAGTSAVRASAAPVQQSVTNYYGPGAEEFWGQVDGRAARVARPIAAQQANQAASASYAAGQQSAPGTINKFNQLKG